MYMHGLFVKDGDDDDDDEHGHDGPSVHDLFIYCFHPLLHISMVSFPACMNMVAAFIACLSMMMMMMARTICIMI